jgi:hypothetical protein
VGNAASPPNVITEHLRTSRFILLWEHLFATGFSALLHGELGKNPVRQSCDQYSKSLQFLWRKRVGVEPTGDRKPCRPPVLKTGAVTGLHALPFSVYHTFTWLQKIYCILAACLLGYGHALSERVRL